MAFFKNEVSYDHIQCFKDLVDLSSKSGDGKTMKLYVSEIIHISKLQNKNAGNFNGVTVLCSI